MPHASYECLASSEIQLEFDTVFHDLTGHTPLGWQRRLYARFLAGRIPDVCVLPTGLGKTSVVPIWLLALAEQAARGEVRLPRRLVYVVHRRTVVDQVTSLAEQLRARLLDPVGPDLERIASALRGLISIGSSPLAVSTLRGELADNREWIVDPSRATIIVGTVDMIGSRLLFSGYGDGQYHRPLHAGLLGQDSLIVLDEAHLVPAFGNLLRTVARVQREIREPRPVRVMELTAVARPEHLTLPDVFRLEPEDEQDAFVQDRLYATKLLRVTEAEIEFLPEKLAEVAASYEGTSSKIIVFVRSPEDAGKISHLLVRRHRVPDRRVALLTGTIRGFERDRLIEQNRVLHAFLDSRAQVDETLYLVCTSAGEVGTDFYADHAVMDPTTLDAFLQRLGRCNRQGGEGRNCYVDVVVPRLPGDTSADDARDPFNAAVQTTARLLMEWNGRYVGPRHLEELINSLEEAVRESAFAPAPRILELDQAIVDAWSLTSVNGTLPGRPSVAPYLHGVTGDPPETYLCWRLEVTYMAREEVSAEEVSRWFPMCRILPHERLRDRADHILRGLSHLLKEHRKKRPEVDFPVVVLDERGNARFVWEERRARWPRLSDILQENIGIKYCTIVLPVEAGGLNPHGMLDPEYTEPARDVCEESPSGSKTRVRRHTRWILADYAGEEELKPLVCDWSGETPEVQLPLGMKEVYRLLLDETDEGTRRWLVLLDDPKEAEIEDPERTPIRQLLDDHSLSSREATRRISGALGLPPDLADALEVVAGRHDAGKLHPLWQHYAGNTDGGPPLARSDRYGNPGLLRGYRHEFGSLLDAEEDTDLQNHPARDLVLHLIASHHGWARPHFEPGAYDNRRPRQVNERVLEETVRRFVRLQRLFGWWGLAWLEALVRCADLASVQEAREEIP